MLAKFLVAAVAIPALLVGSIAAEDEAFEPCGEDLKHPVLAKGDSMSESPTGVETFSFYVDPTASDKGRVNVSATLVWDNFVNDWDLDVAGVVSENFQPFDPAMEQASYVAKGDCKLITVSVVDFTAPLPEISMTLDISIA